MAHNESGIGIVLTNIGCPASPDQQDIRNYLIEFLSDKNIVRMPSALWQPVLRGIVARTRPAKTQPRYEHIWTDEGSPLIVTSLAQRDALNRRFVEAGLPHRAEVGMRYGSPSFEDAVASLEQQGFSRIVAFPLFPQSAFTTVYTSKEKMLKVMGKRTDSRLVGVVEGYADNPFYLDALRASIEEAWEMRPGSKLLFSFHSVPQNDIAAGDTYLEEIGITLSRLTESMDIAPDDWAVAYHSRFEDSRAWVAPHPKTVLSRWTDEGVSRVAVLTPGFAADCLESLYDIDVVLREAFDKFCGAHGLEADFTYVPALNDRADHIEALFDVVANERYTTL